MKIVAICGSLRSGSNTQRAIETALKGANAAGAETTLVNLSTMNLPWCDGRLAEATYEGDTAQLRAVISDADGLLLGSPEYHGSLSGVLKNALDLMGPDHIRGSLIGLLATARQEAGAMNTLNHMRHICRWMDCWVLPTQVSIPLAQDAFENGEIARPGLEDELLAFGKELVRYAGLLSGG